MRILNEANSKSAPKLQWIYFLRNEVALFFYPGVPDERRLSAYCIETGTWPALSKVS